MTQTLQPSATSALSSRDDHQIVEHLGIATSVDLTDEQVEQIGRELDAIRERVMNDLGTEDADYIRQVITIQRALEVGSRAVLLFSTFPPAWIVGTLGLAVAKILDNMEIGHNVLHGQWDWMRDPKIHSSTWEWDHATPGRQWQHTHNDLHHTWTNIRGKDNDLGYGIMRVDSRQEWEPWMVFQPLVNTLNALFFQYGIAIYDLEISDVREGKKDPELFKQQLKEVGAKVARQLGKDYVFFPLLSGPGFLHTVAANATANVLRNLWSHAVIMCGHFPRGVETFQAEGIQDGESKGQWYLRNMLGSANISGPTLVHIMTGYLSLQIEHHLFPDMPSRRLAQVAPEVKEIFRRHGLRYVEGSVVRQTASSWAEILRLSLPDKKPGESRVVGAAKAIGGAIAAGVRKTREPKARRGQGRIATA